VNSSDVTIGLRLEVKVAVSGHFDGVANRVRGLAPVARDRIDAIRERVNRQ
jgi:hypothetical protein